MPSHQFPKLAIASIAANFADQMTLALLPLILVAAGADAPTVSLVVAAQAAAWLLVSLPVGAYADAISRRSIMTSGALLMLGGSAVGGTALLLAFVSSWLLALAAFVVAAGVVMLVLSVFALVPRAVATHMLASANAFLEFGRACACIAAPALAAALVVHGAGAYGFGLAFAGGAVALAAARMSAFDASPAPQKFSLSASIRDGAAFVVGEPILRAIALCAVAWNSAFFALTAVFAPYAANELGMTVTEIGRSWSIYGFGLMLGSVVAAPMIKRLPTKFMFVFGPAMSCVAVVVLIAGARRGSTWPASVALFALGFGPMTWLVLQTSVRQIVTPHALLGRVGATISTTIYGVRPLGALAAGALAANFGTAAALWMSASLFFLSCIFLMLSPAARLNAMPKPA